MKLATERRVIHDDEALSGIDHREERLRSYSDLHRTNPVRVYLPRDAADVIRIFRHASHGGASDPDPRHVTIRGAGHAFDSQSLGTELVISMERFDKIEVREDRAEVCVGGGATWGLIVHTLEAQRLVPAGTVTSSHATAGGTLSSDCLSRFSPRSGKEATSVVDLDDRDPGSRGAALHAAGRRGRQLRLDGRRAALHGSDRRVRLSRGDHRDHVRGPPPGIRPEQTAHESRQAHGLRDPRRQARARRPIGDRVRPWSGLRFRGQPGSVRHPGPTRSGQACIPRVAASHPGSCSRETLSTPMAPPSS